MFRPYSRRGGGLLNSSKNGLKRNVKSKTYSSFFHPVITTVQRFFFFRSDLAICFCLGRRGDETVAQCWPLAAIAWLSGATVPRTSLSDTGGTY